jgi:transposase InsO family protein
MAIKTEASQRDCYFILTEVFNTPKKFTNVLILIKSQRSRKGTVGTMLAEFQDIENRIYGNKLISKEQMERDIFEFIEIWYNKRRHSALDYKTIEEFWKQKIILKMLLN